MKNRIVDYKFIRQMRRSSRWICGGGLLWSMSRILFGNANETRSGVKILAVSVTLRQRAQLCNGGGGIHNVRGGDRYSMHEKVTKCEKIKRRVCIELKCKWRRTCIGRRWRERKGEVVGGGKLKQNPFAYLKDTAHWSSPHGYASIMTINNKTLHHRHGVLIFK